MFKVSWITLANGLSVSRFLLACILCATIYVEAWWFSAIVFVLGCTSDVLDGWVARRRSQVTSIGGKLDHGADAFFVSTGIFVLGIHGITPIILAPLIVFAFLQYLLDSSSTLRGTLRPSVLGKWNGIGYFVLLGFGIGQQATEVFLPYLGYLTYWAGWLLVCSTVLSLIQRYRFTKSVHN